MSNSTFVRIHYLNWKGEAGERVIQPTRIWFGKDEWHPEPQWLLQAYDLGKHEERTFAMKDISWWKPEEVK
jgi:predicted DNA-binding transcriptional regulator YafY